MATQHKNTPWTRLLVRYADGRQLCNCNEAYYDDQGRCRYGCSVNQLNARDDIAAKVEAEFMLKAQP